MKKLQNKINEIEVEEALASNLLFLKKLLNLTFDLKILARQLKLKSGEQRLDLLLSHGKEIYLVELKVTDFRIEYIKQVVTYREEIIRLQKAGELVNGQLKSFLLVTNYTNRDKELCSAQKIEIVAYKPIDVMKEYYDNLSLFAPFLKIKPKDYGVFNLGLINRVLNTLRSGIFNQKDIVQKTGLSKGSVHNHLKVAKEFGLVRERNKQYFLTDFGDKYLECGNKGIFLDTLTNKQSDILKQFVAKDPFYSSTIFGIYAIVESAFILSRNSYPIEFDELVNTFKIIGGKRDEWQSFRSKNTATYTFLNFAIDLGLLGKIGKQILITPTGFRFILMLQLHKSIEMIDSISLEQNGNE